MLDSLVLFVFTFCLIYLLAVLILGISHRDRYHTAALCDFKGIWYIYNRRGAVVLCEASKYRGGNILGVYNDQALAECDLKHMIDKS